MCTARESERGNQQAVAPRTRARWAVRKHAAAPEAIRARKAPGRSHKVQKRQRHHAATDDWRRRVAHVDHHQRFGDNCRNVSVRAAHSNASHLCAQHVRASK